MSAEYLAYKTSRHVFANSVVGYIAWLLRVNGPMPLDDIFNHVMLAKEELRKPNGTTPNIQNRYIVASLLFLLKRVFIKRPDAKWQLTTD